MLRKLIVVGGWIGMGLLASWTHAAVPRGVYLESRTCQVYTGPCFAAGEVGLAGKEAVMAWHFDEGEIGGQSLAGLNLVAIVQTDRTLGFDGVEPSDRLRVRVVVDRQASDLQKEALMRFLREANPRLFAAVVDVVRSRIDMKLDTATLRGELDAGKYARLSTRKADADDCICSNESAYYPPLTPLENFVPGVALEFAGRAVGRRWSTFETRSAYMGRFEHQATTTQVADGS